MQLLLSKLHAEVKPSESVECDEQMQRDEIKKLRHRRISNQLEREKAARLQKWSTEDLVGQSVKLIWINK